MSTASPGERMSAGPPWIASRTRAMVAAPSAVAVRSATRVRIWVIGGGFRQGGGRWQRGAQVASGAAGNMGVARDMDEPPALIVAGPTCSGKSALALALAERLGGTVINADSMQVYRELRVLTARPTPEEEARVPHRLYGIRPAAEAGSVAWWRNQALTAMGDARAAGRLPILTGGT